MFDFSTKLYGKSKKKILFKRKEWLKAILKRKKQNVTRLTLVSLEKKRPVLILSLKEGIITVPVVLMSSLTIQKTKTKINLARLIFCD